LTPGAVTSRRTDRCSELGGNKAVAADIAAVDRTFGAYAERDIAPGLRALFLFVRSDNVVAIAVGFCFPGSPTCIA
jgi:hypothetical protein